jgi:hypothetical protein
MVRNENNMSDAKPCNCPTYDEGSGSFQIHTQECKSLASLPVGESMREDSELQLIAERDEAEEWAHRLAYAKFTIEQIGEHSNLNNPWQNALELLEAESRASCKCENCKLGVGESREPLPTCPKCGCNVEYICRNIGCRKVFAPSIPAEIESTCQKCEEKDKLLARIASIVASQPTVTGLQAACVNDHSIIPMAIRDAQDTFRDTLKRTKRELADSTRTQEKP